MGLRSGTWRDDDRPHPDRRHVVRNRNSIGVIVPQPPASSLDARRARRSPSHGPARLAEVFRPSGCPEGRARHRGPSTRAEGCDIDECSTGSVERHQGAATAKSAWSPATDAFEVLGLRVGRHSPAAVRSRAEQLRLAQPKRRAQIDAAAAVLGDPHRQACYRSERLLRRVRAAGAELSARDLSLVAGTIGEILGPAVDPDDYTRTVGRPGEQLDTSQEARRRFAAAIAEERRVRWAAFRRLAPGELLSWAAAGATLFVLSLMPWFLNWVQAPPASALATDLPSRIGSPVDLLAAAVAGAAYSAAVVVLVGMEMRTRRRAWHAALPTLLTSWLALNAGWWLLPSAPAAAAGVAAVGTWLATFLLPRPGRRQAEALNAAGLTDRERPDLLLDKATLERLWLDTLGDWTLQRAQYRTVRLGGRDEEATQREP